MRRLAPVPYFLNAERTPLVDQLLDILKERDEYISDLESEINRLKKLPSKPKFDKRGPAKEKAGPMAGKRPGSKKAQKTAALPIHQVHVLKVEDRPMGAKFKGHRHFTVQDISIKVINHLFKCERWQLANGSYVQAGLPVEYKGQHFGPYLRAYVLHQVYHQGVTRGPLLGQLQEWGVRMSKGQLNNLLIKDKAAYHAEKAAVFETGCFVSSYLQVDDTGARHKGKNGFCTYVGNEYFAFFESTSRKCRLNYLRCLMKALPDVVGPCLDETAFYYLKQCRSAGRNLLKMLDGIRNVPQCFHDEEGTQVYLKRSGIVSPHEVRLCTEAALFSPLKRFLWGHKDILFLSDEAGQFKLPSIKHALCWLHVERKFKRLLPYTEEQQQLVSEKQEKLWALYGALKEHKLRPCRPRKKMLRKQFNELCAPVEDYLALNEVLARIKRWEKKLLLVLDCPLVPLHNNTAERDIREMVRRRRTSGSTRHDLGRQCRDTFASLKKTCQKVGTTFWGLLLDHVFQNKRAVPLATLVRLRAEKDRLNFCSPLPGIS